MGNRAVITIDGTVGVYIHWNGGPESVTAFLDACLARGYRDPWTDPEYAMARLVGLLCEFFGQQSDSCVGVGTVKKLNPDLCDNGLYKVGQGWKITKWTGGDIEPFTDDQQKKYGQIIDRLVDKVECLT